MVERTIAPSPGGAVGVNLKTYPADIRLANLTVGIDNIHFDVFLSPRFVEMSHKYLLDLLRQVTNAAQFYGMDAKSFRPPETTAFKKVLVDILQASLTHAQFQKNIETDILFRLAVLKHLTQEISGQFNNLMLECKERVKARGEQFSEQGYILRARLNELQADRRNVYRQVGQQLFQILGELEDSTLTKLRRALFGDDFAGIYGLFKNRLLFVEGGRDDQLYLDHYVLVGNFVRDQDRFENIEAAFLEFLRDAVMVEAPSEEVDAALRAHQELSEKVQSTRSQVAALEEQRENLHRSLHGGEGLMGLLRGRRDPGELKAELSDVEKRIAFLQQRLEELAPQLDEAKGKAEYVSEQYRNALGDYLFDPENAKRLFDPKFEDPAPPVAELRSRLLDAWVAGLEQRGLLFPALASYEVRNLAVDYCPPVNLQQLKRALVNRDEMKQVEEIIKQFTAKQLSTKRIEEASKGLRRYLREEICAVVRRFAEDFIRLRRDLRNYQKLVALMERINLIRAEPTRELSRLNNSLYEYLLPDEARPAEDRVVSHAVIKADVRGSTKITQDLLARGLNPASHFSMNLHAPVKKILERYGAAKVFIEGDAIILAIYETESNRSHQRAVAKACVLAREILAVSQSYNARVESSDLPRLELGVGVAFQDSPPTFWVDSDSRVMISKALNLSDRLSSCSKVAKRLMAKQASPFNLFVFETALEGTSEEEAEELVLRYNLNGIELNEEGFHKLSDEISLREVKLKCPMPWGIDQVTLCVGEVPIGETLERLVLRKGLVRQVQADGKIGHAGTRTYYEVVTNSKVIQAALDAVGAATKPPR